MKKVTRLFVKFYIPGSFVSETFTKDILNEDPYLIEWPGNAYAFTINKREDVVDGGSVYEGKTVQVGPVYYHPDSKVENIDQVKQNPNKGRYLVYNMECNGWDKVVWSRFGSSPQPYEDGKSFVLIRK